jgi:hypothetical protein
MFWQNLDLILGNNDASELSQSSINSESDSRFPKPGKRWGQASVSANNCLYIIGGYDGKIITL